MTCSRDIRLQSPCKVQADDTTRTFGFLESAKSILGWCARPDSTLWGSGPEELRAATFFLAITERRRISHSDSTSLGPKNCSGYDYTQIWWVIPTIVRLQIRGHSSHWLTLRSIWRSSSSHARPSERRDRWDWPRTGSCTDPSFSNHISKSAMLLLVEHKVAKAA